MAEERKKSGKRTQGILTSTGQQVGGEELFDNESTGATSGMSIEKKPILKATSGVDDRNRFIPLDASDEARTPRVSRASRPKCEYTKRMHLPATRNLTFDGHSKYGNSTVSMCDVHSLQFLNDPTLVGTDDLSLSPEGNKAANRRSFLRRVGLRNSAADSVFRATGVAPLLQTSGRPTGSQTTVDEDLMKDYKDKGLTIDHVTPVIEQAEQNGGRAVTPYDDETPGPQRENFWED